MVRSKLSNKFLKLKNEKTQLPYNRQRKYYNKLQRQKKKEYFENIYINSITDNKLFWKIACTLFSEKNVSPKIVKSRLLKKMEF